MESVYKISRIYFDQDKLVIILDDHSYTFNLKDISERLLQASEAERNDFIISPSGYGIHWPLLDEDLSIPGLLNLKRKDMVA
ncbi:MAG: DUF2442 domain-containing protein [Bacteroidales bacterium]